MSIGLGVVPGWMLEDPAYDGRDILAFAILSAHTVEGGATITREDFHRLMRCDPVEADATLAGLIERRAVTAPGGGVFTVHVYDLPEV